MPLSQPYISRAPPTQHSLTPRVRHRSFSIDCSRSFSNIPETEVSVFDTLLQVYFYKVATKESMWEHPMDQHYMGLVNQARAPPQDIPQMLPRFANVARPPKCCPTFQMLPNLPTESSRPTACAPVLGYQATFDHILRGGPEFSALNRKSPSQKIPKKIINLIFLLVNDSKQQVCEFWGDLTFENPEP